jgi:hypothetical protein
MLICAHPEVRMKKKRKKNHLYARPPTTTTPRSSFLASLHKRCPSTGGKKAANSFTASRGLLVAGKKGSAEDLQVPCGCKVTLDKEKRKKKQGLWEVKREKKRLSLAQGKQASHTHS